MTEIRLGIGAAFRWGLDRDIRLGMRSIAEILVVLGFFFIVATLFPIGVGPDPRILSRIGAGIIWVCATLACLLSLARMFTADYADGTLEQMLFAAAPFEAIVAGKIAAHWVTTGCPLLLCAPLVGLQFGLGAGEIGVLMLSLALGTPVLSLIGAIMAGLTLGLRGAGALLALLLLPLYVPVLVFGAGAVDAHAAGVGIEGHFSVLGAELILALVSAPFAAAAAVRTAID
jgi:heme exporter protein B